MRKILAVLALGVATAVAGHAQLAVYGGFTTSKLSTPNTPRLNGGTFGAIYDSKRFPVVNFGIDVRGTVLPVKDTTGVTIFTAGPRAVFHLPLIPVRPYAEAGIGGGKVQFGSGGIGTYNSGSFAASVTAGADLHILPLIDWRVIDYSYIRLVGPKTNQNSITTGIVIRIPFS
ncbi:MAG TPA: outer membrane beta-barrel protein [Edaphobacter sp.]